MATTTEPTGADILIRSRNTLLDVLEERGYDCTAYRSIATEAGVGRLREEKWAWPKEKEAVKFELKGRVATQVVEAEAKPRE